MLVQAHDQTGVPQVAGLLLKKYKEKFSGGAVHASWVYLRQWAVGAMPANPLTSYDTSARHLRDPTFLKRALRSGRLPAVDVGMAL